MTWSTHHHRILALLLALSLLAVLILVTGGTSSDGALHGLCTIGTPEGSSCADALMLAGYP